MLDKGNKMISRDLKRILCASGISILVLSGVMAFSPLNRLKNRLKKSAFAPNTAGCDVRLPNLCPLGLPVWV